MIAQAASSVLAPLYSTAGASSVLQQTRSAAVSLANAKLLLWQCLLSPPPYSSMYTRPVTGNYQAVSNSCLSSNFGGPVMMRAPGLGQAEIGGLLTG